MKYLKIKDDMYLTELEVIRPQDNKEDSKEDSDEAVGKTNRIFIIDRSGSMYYTLPQVVEDLITRVRQLPLNDTVSIGYFSSEGQYNFIIKGFKITESADYDTLKTIILNNNTTLNLTCFSEILHSTKQLVEDLTPISTRFSLCFQSDGYPVVSDYKREISSIFEAIKNIEGRLSSVLIIGYGNYYNKELLSKMAEAFGGSLVHSSNINDYKILVTSFIESSKDKDEKIKFDLDFINTQANDIGLIYSVNGSDINLYQLDESDNSINFIPNRRGKNWLYIFSSSRPDVKDIEEIKLTNSSINSSTTKIEHFLRGLYACSYLLVQRCKSDKALEVLSVLGDKYLIDRVNNSFTLDEYGKVESDIKDCLLSTNRRFLNGRNVDYLPKDDAFCLLDLIDALCIDDEAYFYPYHPSFNYNRIGRPQVVKDGYPKFEPLIEPFKTRCKLGDLVWNESRLNLSIRTVINGCIRLPKDYKNHGLKDRTFDTFVYKNYTIVRDGFLNVTVLPVSMSGRSFDICKDNGLIDHRSDYDKNGIYTLYLNRIPVINRSISKRYTSAKDMFDKCRVELELRARKKVLKAIESSLSLGKKTIVMEDYTDKQLDYLTSLGIISNGGYSPPTINLEANDHYLCTEFEVKVKGFSGLPSMHKVKDKINNGKRLTISESLMNGILNEVEKDLVGIDDTNKSNLVGQKIGEVNRELYRVRSDIQRIKFAVILGKSWFDEFTTRDKCSMDVNGNNYELCVKQAKIYI